MEPLIIPNSRAKISDELRELVAKYIVDQHHSPAEASITFGIKANTAGRIAAIYRNDGRIKAHKRGGACNKKITDDIKDKIRMWVDEDCTLPLAQVASKVASEFGVVLSRKTVERCLNELHYTLKTTSLVPAARNDPTTIQKRIDFIAELVALEPGRIVFVDEVGFCYTLRLSRGRSLAGMRANVRLPAIRSKNNSIAAAMDMTGLIMFQMLDRAYNTDLFGDYMASLCDALNDSGRPNRIMIMDNVPFHRSNVIKETCHEKGHNVLYLPPYSPFLNPIENLFSKWKQIVKRSCPSSSEQLEVSIIDGANQITAADCVAFIGHLRSYFQRCLRGEPIDN